MIKRNLLLFSFLLCFTALFSQAPQSIKYQGVLRDTSGNYLPQHSVALRLSVLHGSASGSVSYAEIQNTNTNQLGIFNVEIGKGTPINGAFDTINWGNGTFFIKTEADISGGNNFSFVGTTQFLSVPYALYANKAKIGSIEFLTTSQIDNITPTTGLMVYNSTTNQIFVGIGNAWMVYSGVCYPFPTIANAGPDQILNIDSAVLTGNQPIYGTGLWAIISGTGGTLSQPNSPAAVLHSNVTTQYILTWTITTGCGVSIDTVKIFLNSPIPGAACPGLASFIYGGQTYNTVQIGSQCWMKSNLNIGTMINSPTPPANNGIIEKYCWGNNSSNCNTYGGIYNWSELMGYTTNEGTQGICPAGWHIPSLNDFCSMFTFLDPSVNCSTIGWTGTNAGGKAKEIGTSHWQSPNTGATNESGFTALGSGYWGNYDGPPTFYSNLISQSFWTSTLASPGIGNNFTMSYDNANIFHQQFSVSTLYLSVRCVKD